MYRAITLNSITICAYYSSFNPPVLLVPKMFKMLFNRIKQNEQGKRKREREKVARQRDTMMRCKIWDGNERGPETSRVRDHVLHPLISGCNFSCFPFAFFLSSSAFVSFHMWHCHFFFVVFFFLLFLFIYFVFHIGFCHHVHPFVSSCHFLDVGIIIYMWVFHDIHNF